MFLFSFSPFRYFPLYVCKISNNVYTVSEDWIIKFTILRQTYLEKHCNVPFTKSNCSSFAIQNNSHTRKPIHHMSRHVMDECTTTIRCANGCALTWNASLAVSLTALHRAACGTPGVRQASRLDTARSWLQTYG